MNVKQFFFLFCAVLSSFTLTGQVSGNAAIEAKINEFIELTNNQEWDKAFDLIYPKLFTKVPKQDLVDMMVGMEADGLLLNMSNTKITSTSAPMKVGNETFIKVNYTADMRVSVRPNGLYDAQKSMMAIEEQFQHTYGKENVKLDMDRKQYQIKANKTIMAIQADGADWTLLEINMDEPELMTSLLPSTVMETVVRTQ